jgi:hypothetical protein
MRRLRGDATASRVLARVPRSLGRARNGCRRARRLGCPAPVSCLEKRRTTAGTYPRPPPTTRRSENTPQPESEITTRERRAPSWDLTAETASEQPQGWRKTDGNLGVLSMKHRVPDRWYLAYERDLPQPQPIATHPMWSGVELSAQMPPVPKAPSTTARRPTGGPNGHP